MKIVLYVRAPFSLTVKIRQYVISGALLKAEAFLIQHCCLYLVQQSASTVLTTDLLQGAPHFIYLSFHLLQTQVKSRKGDLSGRTSHYLYFCGGGTEPKALSLCELYHGTIFSSLQGKLLRVG